MGRKTHETSIGRVLPGRKNIIISRDKTYEVEGAEVVHSLDEAIAAAAGADEVFIIGGASIYDLAMPILDKIYLTKVDAQIEGDRYFKFDKKNWQKIRSEPHAYDNNNNYAFDLQVWERKS